MNRNTSPKFSSILLALLVLPIYSGCHYFSKDNEKPGREPAPPPPQGKATYADLKPDNAFVELAPGVLTRTWFEADSGNGYRVEVRELLIATKQSNPDLKLPGAAICEVRSGSGTLEVGGQTQELGNGSTFAVAEGEPLKVASKGEYPIALRVHLLKSN